MPKKPGKKAGAAKPQKKSTKQTSTRTRTASRRRARRTDEFGVPLTSNSRYFTILPSDLMPAFDLPPEAPKKGKLRAEPSMATTAIPELRMIEFTEYAYHCVIAAIRAADKVQIEKLNPSGGANLRYRIEIAAAFLSHVIEHAYEAAIAGDASPDELVNLSVQLVVRRAEEIYGQSGA